MTFTPSMLILMTNYFSKMWYVPSSLSERLMYFSE